MKKLIIIFILIVVFTSCKSKTPLASNFNLKRDFTELTYKITELDTVIVWVDMSLCTSQGTEVLTITRKNDSLKIQPKYRESLIIGTQYKQRKSIRVSIHDTLWKFNAFLKRNKERISTDSSKNYRMVIYHNKSKIKFTTRGLSESEGFLFDYSKTMTVLNMDNPLYINEVIQITE